MAYIFNFTSLEQKNIIKFYENDKSLHGLRFNGYEVSDFSIKDVTDSDIKVILVADYEKQDSIIKLITQSGYKCETISLFN